MKSYRYCICIGRFQPFHSEHFNLIYSALNYGEKVIIILGSHIQNRSLKNPWTVEERKKMIRGCFTKSECARIQFISIQDYDTDQEWVGEIHRKVQKITCLERDIAIFDRDNRQVFCTQYFPFWHYASAIGQRTINATDIRIKYFQQLPETLYEESLHPHVAKLLRQFKSTEIYQQLSTLAQLKTKS